LSTCILGSNSDVTMECVKAISRLIGSAGISLREFRFQLTDPWRDIDCGKSDTTSTYTLLLILFDPSDAIFQHIDLTANSNLQFIALDVNNHSFIIPFLQRLTRSSNPSSLKQLHIPYLVYGHDLVDSEDVELEFIDEILQHPYFSTLEEFRFTVDVYVYGFINFQEVPAMIQFEEPTEGTKPMEEMILRVKELKSRMPGLVKRGVLKIDEEFRLVFWHLVFT
jgi:hypothetical protein